MHHIANLLLLFALAEPAPTPRWLALNQAARSAVQAKDYTKLRDTLIQLSPLIPGNPRVAYNLAASEAQLGHSDAAFARLRDWEKMGLVYDLAGDADFTSLRNTPEFQQIVQQVATHQKPVSSAALAFRIPGNDLLAEDIAYDAKTRRFFISSVRQGKIFTADGKLFASAEWGVLALRADSARRTLWASIGWLPHCEACKLADKDKTALLAFDLETGALKQRIESPLPGLLGDMTLSQRGDIIVSEGIHGAVLRLRARAAKFERLDTEGEFPSPQTPALSTDEKTLYIPDYVRGIAAMNLATRSVTWLQPAAGIALSGIDGLYVYRNSFLAVQNGTTPPRVIRFGRDLQSQQVLEANTPGLGEPTHGVVVGSDFYFIAGSGWSDYDDAGKKKEGTAPVQSEVQKVKLTR